jgi:hypothetical protein
MKKVILSLCVVTISLLATAQLGVKAGMNISTWNGDDAEGAKSLTGFYVGAQYMVSINEKFSVVPEAVYSMEGAKDDATDIKIKTDFINVAAMFRYNSSGFYVGTGPQLGFLMSAKADDGTTTADVKDAFKSTNFSWAFGLGYEMKNGLGIGARYNLGLSSIADDSDTDVKTGVFQIGLTYNFKLGGAAK